LNDCYKGCNLPSLDVPYVKDNFQKALGLLGSAGLPSHNPQHDEDDVDDEVTIGNVDKDTGIVKGKVDSVGIDELSQQQDTQQKDDDDEIVEKSLQETNFIERDGFCDQKSIECEKDLVKSDEQVVAANGGEMEERVVKSVDEEMRHGKEEINRDIREASDGADGGRQRTDSNSSTQSQTATRANALLRSLSSLKR